MAQDATTHHHPRSTSGSSRRLRWVALGATIAALAGAWHAGAAPGAGQSTFVPVTPARILDTRDPNDLGLTGPFLSGGAQDLRVTGLVRTASGDQVVVPEGATGVVLNVTAVRPTAAGFVAVRPADAPGSPTTSSLNVELGSTVPNAVTVALPTSGIDAGHVELVFDAYGNQGPTTDLLVDVVGYYTPSGLADLQAQIDALLGAHQSQQQQLDGFHESWSVYAGGNQDEPVGTADEVVRQLQVVAPTPGRVIVSSTVNVFENTDEVARCSITTGLGVDTTHAQQFQGPVSSPYGQLGATRGFDVAGGTTTTFRLVCDTLAGTSVFSDSAMTAVFTPQP